MDNLIGKKFKLHGTIFEVTKSESKDDFLCNSINNKVGCYSFSRKFIIDNMVSDDISDEYDEISLYEAICKENPEEMITEIIEELRDIQKRLSDISLYHQFTDASSRYGSPVVNIQVARNCLESWLEK